MVSMGMLKEHWTTTDDDDTALALAFGTKATVTGQRCLLDLISVPRMAFGKLK